MAVTPQTLKSNTFLTLDDVKDHLKIPLSNTDHDNRLIRLINMMTDKAESYIDGPIKQREFVEVRDGDASNTIVLDHWPIRSVSEIRIDYQGDFTPPTTIIPPDHYLIRGAPDLSFGIRGTDVVIRNDNNVSIIGRLFIGSVVGSVQITYRAGFEDNNGDIPEDLQYAVLLGIEYFYLLRENRELNLRSKTNTGQSYSREIGLPKEVCDLLDEYKDWQLGRANRPQRNRFSL